MAMVDFYNNTWILPTIPPVDFPTYYPTPPPQDLYSFNSYSYIVVVFLLILMLASVKIAVSRRQSALRKATTREARARQSQLSTISGAVDANSVTSSIDSASTSQQASDAHVKVDLPPTYDEVMKHFLDAKIAAASSDNTVTSVVEATSSTCRTTDIDIEDPPPPQYTSVQPS